MINYRRICDHIRQHVNPQSKAPIIQQVKAIDANGQFLPDADTYIPSRFVRITQQELLVRISEEVSGDCTLRVVRRHPATTGDLIWGEGRIKP
ncbi:hypothetical protein [Cerasicoccus frondis]|uniref:hypothetical protein n=1 Tax=Cerasicoccus frondis TaxID=490090 RepID=UPI00285275BF|nr:hypothetical protein [Cerasicoccus frondis]